MRFLHPAHRDLGVRLGYGLNLYPSRDAAGVLAGLRAVAVPLAERLAPRARAFGVGAWLPAAAARVFAHEERRFEELAGLVLEHGLDPFTCNAFPAGDFHSPGLKERVFEPTWRDEARLAFTLDVARVAVRLRAARGGSRAGEHLSLSTHAGQFGPFADASERERAAANFVRAARALAELEAESGERVVLALEPEPRSSANDTRELAALFEVLRLAARRAGAEAALARHVGACLDTCHAAIEFEPARAALEQATERGAPLGKLQLSSALALRAPAEDERGRAQFLGMDEPTYLHQVTARTGAGLLRARDLSEVRARWEAGERGWRGADEWRCHYHVPVDLDALAGRDASATGLATTRAEAVATLGEALRAPERWGARELHVEVETYTWSLLAGGVETGAVVDGLEREWRHAAGELARAGWQRVGDPPAAR